MLWGRIREKQRPKKGGGGEPKRKEWGRKDRNKRESGEEGERGEKMKTVLTS